MITLPLKAISYLPYALTSESNFILHLFFLIFSYWYHETDQMSAQFRSLLSLPLERGRVRVGMELIPKPNPIFHFHFFVFGNGDFKTNQMGLKFLIRMGVRKHLPIARDGFLH